MRTKLFFLPSLFCLSLVFILYVTPADAGTGKSELSYTCLGKGIFQITVKVPAQQRYMQFPTFCRITVIPHNSSASAFTYHLNQRSYTALTAAGQNFSRVISPGGELVFSRELNLGVYAQWCNFSVIFDGAANREIPRDASCGMLYMQLEINRCEQPCRSRKVIVEDCEIKVEKETYTTVANIVPVPQPSANKLTTTFVDALPTVTEAAPIIEAFVEEAGHEVILTHIPETNDLTVSVRGFELFLAAMEEEEKIAEAKLLEELASLPAIPRLTLPEGFTAKENENSFLNTSLLLYPSPSSGDVNLRIEGAPDKTFSLLIIDISGKKVLETKNISGNYLIERNSLPAGIYKVMLSGNEGGFYSGTFVLQ